MRCPKCQHENPNGAKFCNECGDKLDIACQECGNINPRGSNFCNACDRGVLGRSYLNLGLLYKAKGEKHKTGECISKTTEILEHCEAEVYLNQAKEALTSLE